MADDLKRVGLVFKADGTTDFSKSLTTINALTQESYANFKLVQSQYDKNTSSLTKLKNQQNYMSQNTELYRNKVAVLEEQLNELENAEDRNEKAIANKKKQLANAQKTLGNYEKGLKEISDQLNSGSAQLKEYSENIADASEKMSSAGKTMTTHVTAPILAIGAASMVAWNELDEAYDGIVAGTGATGDALESLQSSFDKVFGSMPVEASDASTAITDLNIRFGFTEKTLEDASKSFLKFAEVNGTDVSSAIANVSRAMNDAGIDSKEYQSVLDALTASSQGSGIGIDELASSLSKNGAVMRSLGFDTNETIAMLASLEKSGADTSVVLTGMKKAMQTYADSGKDAKTEFEKLVKGIQDGTVSASDAMDVFGTRSGAVMYQYIQEGKLNFDEFNKIVEQSSGIVDQSFNDMLDPVDSAKTSLNNIKLVGADLADTIQGALAPILEKVSKILEKFSGWFKSLDPNIKTVIVTVAALAASIGPVLVAVGALGTQVSKGLEILSKLKLVLYQNNGAFSMIKAAVTGLSGPMIAIIAVIALVTAAVIDLWKNNEEFRQNITGMINNIVSIVQNLYTSILQPIISAVIALIAALWETCIKPLYENVKNAIAETISVISSFMSFVTPIINTIVNLLGVVITNVLNNVLLPVFQMVFGAISTLVGVAFNTISVIYNNILKPVFDLIVDVITNIVLPAFTIGFAGICTVVSSAFSFIAGIYDTILKPGFDMISNGINTLKNTFTSSFNSIKSFTTSVWNGIKSAITTPMNSAKSLIQGIINSIKGFFNFKISWPKIPLPHFSIKPKGWGIGDLLKGKIPSLGIDWYAKAMDKGMILDSATIFGYANGNLLGGGEAGSETVVGTQSLMSMIKEAVNSAMSIDNSDKLERIIELLMLILNAINQERVLSANNKQLVLTLAPDMDVALKKIKDKKGRI